MPVGQWPAWAIPALRTALRDRRDTQRALAIELCAPLLDDRLASELLELLADDEEELSCRLAATSSLSVGLEPPSLWTRSGSTLSEKTCVQIQLAMKQRYYDGSLPDELRRAVLLASTRSEEGWHQGAVRAAYRAPELEWRRCSLHCMANMEGFDALILEGLQAPEEELRVAAMQSATRRGLLGGAKRVRERLLDERASLDEREEALKYLAQVAPRQLLQSFESLRGASPRLDQAFARLSARIHYNALLELSAEFPDDDSV